jgi:hypothetical protein
LGECLVSWLRNKQSSVSLSTTEAKYIAATTCCTQVLWMKQNLTDIQVEYDEPIPIYCDNTSDISISKNLVMHSKKKHIHFLWEQVVEKNIKVEYVGTQEQVADIFTKPLPRDVNSNLVQYLLQTDIQKRTENIQWQIQTLHRDFSPGNPNREKPAYIILIHLCYIVYNTIYI